MKAKLLLFLVILICSVTSNAQNKHLKSVVAFYNLENLFDTVNQEFVDDEEFTPTGKRNYTGAIYWDKENHLAQVIAEIGTDVNPDGAAILGVSEIENRSVLNDLVKNEQIADRNYRVVHYDSKDARGVDVGLLYNPKYFKLISSKKLFVDLSDVGEGYTRDVLYAKGMLLGEEVHIMVGHWPSRRGGEEASMPRRCKAAEVMRIQTDSIFMTNPNAKVIVMGDFNDDPNSPSVIKCLKSKLKQEEMDSISYFNPFNQYFSKGIGTLAYQESWNLFDQILVTDAFLTDTTGLRYSGAYIFKRKYMTTMDGPYKGYPLRTYGGDLYQGGYSDHFPTFIVLKKNL